MPAHEDMCLRAYSSVGESQLPIRWLRAIGAPSRSPRCAARDLYCGSHWVGVLALAETAESLAGVSSCDLWVCSAGYGLVHATEQIASYAATFARGQDDSVRGDHAAWWESLAKWKRSNQRRPRSVATLARRDPEAVIIVIASSGYVSAMRDDLVDARALLSDSSRLLISSATSRAQSKSANMKDLERNILPVRSQIRLMSADAPSSRGLVNVHAVRHLLQSNCWQDCATATTELEHVQRELGADKMPERKPMSDEQVLTFIRGELKKDGRATKTRLLRALRDSNKACEQSRFGALFEQEARSSGR